MELGHIAAFIAVALCCARLLPSWLRGWGLLAISVVAVYWLQPPLPIRHLDFIFPSATIALTLIVWWITQNATRPQDAAARREDLRALGLIVALVVGLSLTRFLVPELRPTASRAPDTFAVVLLIALLAGALALLWKLVDGRRGLLAAAIALIVALFVLLKAEPLTLQISALFRAFSGQDAALAAVTDLRWLGFSYVAFRLIHLLRDRQMGRLPVLSLREHMTFVIFFPALVAGPIDRAERFVKDLRALDGAVLFTAPRIVEGFGRIVIGMTKKFILADSLALFALNDVNAGQVGGAPEMWLLLYAYAFRLFLDFSGYTDIAIGIAILAGIRLPENFDWPYQQRNIAAFWQSWHITLSSWVRFYVFSPLSRMLLKRRYPALTVVLISQLVTMIVIGLWHSVALNFLIWGVWHGLGLFVHKVWSDRTRQRYLALNERPYLRLGWHLAGTFVTFHFVTIGWVWFALADAQQAWRVFLGLFGVTV